MKLLLVSSCGGHLAELVWMRPFWAAHERVFAVPDGPDVAESLAGERVIPAFGPGSRSLRCLARNALLARRVLRDERPDLVLSTGASIAVPFLLAARLHGVPTVYVEAYDRVDSASLSGRLLRPVVDAVVLQWEEQLRFFPDGIVLGPVR